MGTAGSRGWKVVFEKCSAVIYKIVRKSVRELVQVVVCARFRVLCISFEVELVMGWSRGGGWEVVDLAVERAVKLVNGRSALGKDPQGG